MPRRYKIYQMSAIALASYAEEKENGVYEYKLSAAATERCKTYTAKHEQSDNALFHQIMCVIKGEDFTIDDEVNLVTDLPDEYGQLICKLNMYLDTIHAIVQYNYIILVFQKHRTKVHFFTKKLRYL